MGIHNDFEGLCIGGPLGGQTKRSKWNHFNEQLPSATTVARPDGYALAPGEHSANPDSASYRHVELWAASDIDEPGTRPTRYGFWVPDENYADSHRHILAALTECYSANMAAKRGIHAHIAKKVELAQTYAEDGAFMTAGTIFAVLADDLVTHAHATRPSPKPRKSRGIIT